MDIEEIINWPQIHTDFHRFFRGLFLCVGNSKIMHKEMLKQVQGLCSLYFSVFLCKSVA